LHPQVGYKKNLKLPTILMGLDRMQNFSSTHAKLM